jgi:sarcosine oxidase
MRNDNHYDVIVLGMGVMGSATAYHLARDGKRVLGLEQFERDHRMGSSYGESRIIRYAYDHPIYIEMAKAAYPMWHALQEESGRELMVHTGGLDFGPADYPSLVATRDNLAGANIPYEWLSPAEVAERFPQFVLSDDMRAVYQPDAASLLASRCVIAQVELAQKHGAVIHFNTPVIRIEPQHESVRVHTAAGAYEARSLVVTAGAWAGKVLSTTGLVLPVQPTREEIVFFDPPETALFQPEHFPVFISHGDTYHYGLPNVDGNGVKVGIHKRNEPVDPDTCKRTADDEYIQHMRGFMQTYIPRGVGRVNEARICLYTMTPDEHFIIDRHPAYPHIVLGAGFSGHGFKFGPLIGRILADLATHGTTSSDTSLFAANRLQ